MRFSVGILLARKVGLRFRFRLGVVAVVERRIRRVVVLRVRMRRRAVVI